MPLLVVRFVFLAVAIGLAVLIVNSDKLQNANAPAWAPVAIFGGIVGLAIVVIVFDVAIKRKQLKVITAVYFGLLVGLLLAYIIGLALSPLLLNRDQALPLHLWVNWLLSAVLCYVCVSVLLQTRDDFRFIIPYVEFDREVKGRVPYVLDTSVVIDGRIADVVEVGLIDGELVIPQYAIQELQSIADSADRARRSRGRRGLDVLNRLRSDPKVELRIDERELPEYAGQTIDLKLVLLAKEQKGKIVTHDYNLNKVAQLHGVPVINLNDLANALKPAFQSGESIDVRLVRPGEEPGQGVGYLDDGTMVVVEGGRDHVGQQARITVTSVLQTSAGRMVFGRYEGAAA
jgi:uncharacterized protein YacL